MTLATWKADLNKPTIELTAKLAQKYGYVKSVPSVDDLVWSPSG